jgi:Ubiquitin-activating enzyme E1 FCCH domain
MAQPIIQTSFNAGEWAPALYARVDLTKYHSGAALLRNFFVDYRGGATTRPGTKYILKAKSNNVRLIPFLASFTVTYMLEFGPGYIRFYNNGAPILENATVISGATQANPGVITDTAHGYSNGDWIFITGVAGMTQLNGNYYIVAGVTANTYTLTDLYGVAVNTTTFGAYTSGGTAQRVYTVTTSPYQASDLFTVKYVQNVNQLILCHPNYPPQLLTLNSAANWTLAPINFGPTISAPGGLGVITSGAGSFDVSYTVTSVDANGQESSPAVAVTVAAAVASTQTVSWTVVANAVSYNVYRTIFSAVAIPVGQPLGYIGTSTGVKFIDTNITPNFAITAPIITNPFSGSGVASLTLNTGGNNYSAVPSVSFSGGTPTVAATAHCYLGASAVTINFSGYFFIGGPNLIGYTVTLSNGVTAVVTAQGTAAPGGNEVLTITAVSLVSNGFVTSGAVPSNPITGTLSGYDPANVISAPTFNLTWAVNTLYLDSPGLGYVSTPSVVFTGGAPSPVATATAVLGAAGAGNPAVPGFVQQRLFLGGPAASPAQMNLSQPGAPFNYNVTFPVQPDNAIQETLTNTTLNTIKSVVTVSAGLIVFTDKGAWLINGGSPGSAISATAIVANPQAYSGSSDLPAITTPNDLLYVQSKQSIVRDLAFNFYLNNYVGADISILSSHLFYGFNLIQWCFAEEPFKVVWAVRNDGQLLSLTFIKEQELVAWAHSDTLGSFISIASVNENTATAGIVDAVYTAVQRSINGQTVVYIERMVELALSTNYISSWQVDAGIGYNGAAATTFSGAQHLAGAAVTGLADGVVINFTMPVSGTFVFGGGGTAGLTGIPNAKVVTVGLQFMPQITTLPLDLGEPTVQGKRKKITGLSMKVQNALGLSAGRNISSVVPLADTVIGNVGTMSNAVVIGLVTGDVRLIVDPQWDVYGQYSIVQNNPYPASILGVIPEIEVGDDK